MPIESTRAQLSRAIEQGLSGEALLHLYQQANRDGQTRAIDVTLLRLATRIYSDQLDPTSVSRLRQALGLPSLQGSPALPGIVLPEPAALTTAARGTSAALEARAEEAVLSAAGLQDIYDGLASRFEEPVARTIMLEALDATEIVLSGDAKIWLDARRRRGNVRWQAVTRTLQEFAAGARAVDLNENGELDRGDGLLTRQDGVLRLERISPLLLNRVRMGQSFIAAAQALDEAMPRFELLQNHSFNPRYWEPATGEGAYATFLPPEGVRASEALFDILVNPKLYGYECKTGQVVLFYLAILMTIGPDDFDAGFRGMRVGPQEFIKWSFSPAERGLKDVIERHGRGLLPKPEFADELRPGDAVYFMNWDVSESAAERGWSGENTVYLGHGQFYGHPFGLTTADAIIAFLNSQPKIGEKRSAAMTPKRTDLSASVFDLDKNDSD